jgi:hypothetical protein
LQQICCIEKNNHGSHVFVESASLPSNFFLLIAENGMIKGSITGAPAATRAKKLWLVFEALGDIACAYPYALILLEIQVCPLLSKIHYLTNYQS